MLKTLIKKQLFECFRTYFVNPKTKKARSRGAVAGMFVLFAVLMGFLSVVFFGMAMTIGLSLFETDMLWFYFALMGTVAIMLGTFGSVFNTYASLYLAKDNELLLSMPIPPRYILAARVMVVYGLSLLYSGLVWVPTLLCAVFFSAVGAAGIIFSLLLTLIIPLFVTVLTCALGWVVALVASRIRNKSFIAVLLFLVFFAAYYTICFRMTEIMQYFAEHSQEVGQNMKTYLNLLYQMGAGAAGKVLPFLIFTGVTLALAALTSFVLTKSFTRIVTRSAPTARVSSKQAAKAASASAHGAFSALLRREARRFISSPTYMLNCGLGVFLLPILVVVLAVKRGDVINAVASFGGDAAEVIPRLLPGMILSAVCLVLGMNAVSTPSVSLEGKTLWIVRTLPVGGATVLRAKMTLHLLVNAPVGCICAFAAVLILGGDVLAALLGAVYVAAFTLLTGAAGLMLGLCRPDFEWTTEAAPIKQSLNILLTLLISLGVTMFCGSLISVCGLFIDLRVGLAAAILVTGLTGFGLCRWIVTKGAKRFDSL